MIRTDDQVTGAGVAWRESESRWVSTDGKDRPVCQDHAALRPCPFH